jgi:hypothetical protein
MKKENELVKLFGVNKSVIKDLRSSAPEGSWIRDISKKPEKLWGYLWSETGVKWLSEKLNVNEKNFEVPPSGETSPKEAECTVTRSNFVNLRLIEVIHNGKRRMVQCKDNRIIKEGMLVKIRLIDEKTACISHIISKHLKPKS